jgi:CMP-N-acetylneuraminic acid synthetase
MKKILPVIIAKGHSSRLPGKNTKDFNGAPLFQWNLLKLMSLFDIVVVDSDDENILKASKEMGAIPHTRHEKVIGNDIPSILIFRSILEDFSDYDGVINVQANSPNVEPELIKKAYNLISNDMSNHILTLNENMTWNGSLWCISKELIYTLKDLYNIKPDMFLIDDSVDIHTEDEFKEALNRETKNVK